MLKRRIPALLAFLLALICAMGARPTPAYAHAIMLRSDPPDGAVLAAAPQQVRLWLSEPVALDFTTVELNDSDGRRIAIAAHSDAASLALAVRSTDASTALLLIDLPALPPSAYRLSWRTLSSGDLHVTSGSIVFGVQRAANLAPVAAAATLPPLAEVLLRWLNFGALATLIGALALALLVLPAVVDKSQVTNDMEIAARHRARRRVLRLALWSALATFLLEGVLLLVQATSSMDGQAALTDNLERIISGTDYGSRWLFGQVLALALVAAILALLKTRRDTPLPPHDGPTLPNAVVLDPHALLAPAHAGHNSLARHASVSLVARIGIATLVLALITIQALNSHAAAFASFSPLRVFADALHLLAAGIWAGGLLTLALAILPLLLRGGHAEHALAWSILRRFGGLATISFATLLITGLFMTGQQIASLDALLTTVYGQTLLMKIALAAGVALIGLLNAAALHPRIAALTPALPRHPSPAAAGEGKIWLPSPVATGAGLGVRVRLTRTVLLEALGATLLLLLAATLSATTPARGPAFDPPTEQSAPPTITTQADDLIISLSIKPNRPGQNFLSLGVFNTRRPPPAPINRVDVRLDRPGERGTNALLAAESLGGGRYQVAGDAIDAEGDWSITVIVSRSGLPETQTSIPWIVMPRTQPAEPRPILISNQPLAPALTLAALLTTLALLGGGALLWLRRRRPEDALHPPIRKQAQPAPIKEKRARP